MSWLDDLTPEKELENQAQALKFTDAPPAAGFFQGSGTAAGLGVPRGLIEAKGTVQKTLGFITSGMVSVEDAIAVEDAVTETFQSAREYKPDAATTGFAGNMLHELTRVIPRTTVGTIAGGPVGGFVAAGAPTGVATSEELQAQGVDVDTANKAGAVSGTVMGVGAVLPVAGFAKGLVPDLAAVVGANVALGVTERGANHKILADAGYGVQAEQYKALDLQAAAIDATFGAAFKGVDMVAGKPTKSQVSAALVVNNKRVAAETGPGVAATPKASAIHAEQSDAALTSILNSKPVSIADTITDAEFVRHAGAVPSRAIEIPEAVAEGATMSARNSVVSMITGLESGGKANAKNPRSSATGTGQFIESTWLSMVKKHRPDLMQGKTRAQILELRKDKDLSIEMTGNLVDDNAKELHGYGIKDPTAMELYAAHHFGASRVPTMRKNPGALMDTVLTAAELKANPSYRGKTVAQVVASFEKRAGIKAPVGRTKFASPEQLVQNEFIANAKKLGVSEAVARQIAPTTPMDDVTGFFDARQGGVKTTTIERAQQHVADTGEPAQYVSADVFNLGGLNQAVGNRAEAANVHYRAMADIVAKELEAVGGDVVPLRTGGDEFGAVVINASSDKVQAAIGRAEARVSEYSVKHGLSEIPHAKRSNEKGVGLHFGIADIHPSVSVRDILDRADSGIDASKLGIKYVARETIGTPRPQPSSGQAGGTESGNAAPNGGVRQQGSASSKAKSGRQTEIDSVQNALADAEQTIAESPDLNVFDGFDADGKPVSRSAADALADARAEHLRETQEAEFAPAAIACFRMKGE